MADLSGHGLPPLSSVPLPLTGGLPPCTAICGHVSGQILQCKYCGAKQNAAPFPHAMLPSSQALARNARAGRRRENPIKQRISCGFRHKICRRPRRGAGITTNLPLSAQDHNFLIRPAQSGRSRNTLPAGQIIRSDNWGRRGPPTLAGRHRFQGLTNSPTRPASPLA